MKQRDYDIAIIALEVENFDSDDLIEGDAEGAEHGGADALPHLLVERVELGTDRVLLLLHGGGSSQIPNNRIKTKTQNQNWGAENEKGNSGESGDISGDRRNREGGDDNDNDNDNDDDDDDDNDEDGKGIELMRMRLSFRFPVNERQKGEKREGVCIRSPATC